VTISSPEEVPLPDGLRATYPPSEVHTIVRPSSAKIPPSSTPATVRYMSAIPDAAENLCVPVHVLFPASPVWLPEVLTTSLSAAAPTSAASSTTSPTCPLTEVTAPPPLPPEAEMVRLG